MPKSGSEGCDACVDLKNRLLELGVPARLHLHTARGVHQDHREVAQLVWNTFRDHVILEYEIPKWDGDLGRPNVYMPLAEPRAARKTALLMRHFRTQRSKDWFDERTFAGLMRLRGLECRAQEGMAEAFHARKIVLGAGMRGAP